MLRHLSVCLDNVPSHLVNDYISIANAEGIQNFEAPAYNEHLMTLDNVVALKSIFPSSFNNMFIPKNKHLIKEGVNHIEEILTKCSTSVKAINFGCPGVKGMMPRESIEQHVYMLNFGIFLQEIINLIYKIRQSRNMPELRFCLEPTALLYGSNVLTNTNDVIKVIECIDSDAIKLLFDVGNVVTSELLNANFYKSNFNIEDFGHIHISSMNIGQTLYSDINSHVKPMYDDIEYNIRNTYNKGKNNLPYISLESKMCSNQTLADVEHDLEIFIRNMTKSV